ncbi:MAG: hypothetical protein GF411_09820 [Candidatus Lokiarchaeota archaeon]|nr:hypothetical protein [Candidatus Lokiarchaeota archaeon]
MEIDSGPDPFAPDDAQANAYKVGAIESVSRTFNLFFRKFGTYALVGLASAIYALIVVMTLLAILPPLDFETLSAIINAQGDLVAIFTLLWEYQASTLATFLLILAILALIGTIYYTIIGGAATQIALDNYGAPNRGDFPSSISKAIGRAPALILYQLFIVILTVVLLLPGSIAIAPLFELDPYNIDMAALEAAMTGALLLLVGTVILFYITIRLIPTIAVIMAEDVSIVEALKRSFNLTSGNFLHLLGARIVLAITIVVFSLVIEFALFFIPTGIVYAITALMLSAILLTSFDYIFTAVIYKDLKARKTVVETSEGSNQEWW